MAVAWSRLRLKGAVSFRLALLGCLMVLAPSVSPLLGQKVSAAPDAVYAVIHIDLDSSRVDRGVQLLQDYARACRKSDGNLICQLLQELGRPNHLTLIEGWQDEAAYFAHVGSDGAKRFRSQMQPLLGSPFDERLHRELSPSANPK